MRRSVLVDAVTCIAMGVLLVAGARPLAPLLGLPELLLQLAGVSLFPIAGLWIGGSVVLLIVRKPNALGYAFVIAQALTVAVLAELEYVSAAKSAA